MSKDIMNKERFGKYKCNMCRVSGIKCFCGEPYITIDTHNTSCTKPEGCGKSFIRLCEGKEWHLYCLEPDFCPRCADTGEENEVS